MMITRMMSGRNRSRVQGWEVQGFRGSKVKTYSPERGTLNPEPITENAWE